MAVDEVGDEVVDALAGPVGTGPQLEVLDPVVVADAVAMMHGFPRQEWPANRLFHDCPMFETAFPGNLDEPVAMGVEMTCPVWLSVR